MDWLWEGRSKSVANSAKQIVAQLHRDVESKNKRITDLERLVVHLQQVSTGSLENELFRLELRRKELAAELEGVDAAIVDRRCRLDVARQEVRHAFASASTDVDNRRMAALAVQPSQPPPRQAPVSVSVSDDVKAAKLEQQYFEECEDFLTVRQDAGKNLIFVLHRNTEEEALVVYQFQPPTASTEGTEVIDCKKLNMSPETRLLNFTQRQSELSLMEYYSLGPKIVPNHDRDHPHVRQLVVPAWLLGPVVQDPITAAAAASPTSATGLLLGAVELPLTPDVVIDVWGTGEASVVWGTTSVDGVAFACLERIHVISETVWGLSQVVQVDLLARHPHSGVLLLESIYSDQSEGAEG